MKSAPATSSSATSAIGLALIAGFIFYSTHSPIYPASAATTAFGKASDQVFSSSKSNPAEEISNSNAPVHVVSRLMLTSGQVYVVLDLAPSTGDQFASAYPDSVTPSFASQGVSK